MAYNRQLYKQKPAAWGPSSSVRASIFNNAERIGIDPASIALAMPMWGPGDQLDYAKKLVCTNAGAMYTDNSLYFNNDYVNVSTRPALGDGCLIHTSVKQTGYTVQNSGLLDTNRTASAGYSLVFRSDLGYQFSVGINTSIKRSNAGFGLGLNQISWYWKMGVEQKVYNNGKVLSQDADSSVNNTTQVAPNYDIKIGNYYDLASERGLRGYIEQIIILTGKQNKSLISLFADNPYFLLQRVAPVYYSVPGGAITITTSLDGKVIIRTATAALLDCMASIKNDANNIFDGDAVISTTKSDAIDGKAILKNIAASVFDSKASVLSVASLLLDGKAIVSDTGAALFDGKGAVKDSAYDLIDCKSIIKSMNTAILDGKSIFLSAGTTVIDGKIIVNAEGFSSSLIDGKTIIKSVVTNYLDGLIYIGNAADKNIDGKAIIKSSVGLTIDGKTTIQDVASNLLDGTASILTSIANIVDGKIVISDAAIGLLDGEAVILDDSSIILDGKVFLSSGSEINIFDGKITLSVPIVGKVTVSFSMRSPSVSFAIRTPAATVSIN